MINRCLKIAIVVASALSIICSCTHKDSSSSEVGQRVFWDTVVGGTHVIMCDSANSPLHLRINNKQIDCQSVWGVGESVDIPSAIENGGKGNVLLLGSGYCLVIHEDSVQNRLFAPVLALDTVNSRLLSDRREDGNDLVFYVLDIQKNDTACFRIDDINEMLYYHFSDFSAEFKDGDLYVKYNSTGGGLKETVVAVEKLFE